MRIVVLDGYTLNPGDLSWQGLTELGQCEVHDRTPIEVVVDRARQAEIILTNKTPVTREHIEALPQLRYIGVLATGFNIVDATAARARNVIVTNVPAYGTRSVAQTTFALLLELTHHVGYHAQTVREGRWTKSPDFCYWDFPLIELDRLCLGIIGFGRIGRAVGELGAAFGMKVLFHSRVAPDSTPEWGRYADLPSVFRECDILSLHCPLKPETQHLVNAERLGWMKRSAFLVNTSRGGLIDEQALAQALNTGKLAGAGVDVLSVEPPAAENPLLTAKNCLVTPHLAWATRSARSRLLETAVNNVKAFQEGKPQNVVN